MSARSEADKLADYALRHPAVTYGATRMVQLTNALNDPTWPGNEDDRAQRLREELFSSQPAPSFEHLGLRSVPSSAVPALPVMRPRRQPGVALAIVAGALILAVAAFAAVTVVMIGALR